jgi:hypothetical protein
MTMTVLVLASAWDRTADGVASGLTERGVAVMRVDLSWFPQRLTLDAEFRGGSWHGHLWTEHHEVDLVTVRSVWVRTPSSFQMPTQTLVSNDPAAVVRFAHVSSSGVVLKPLSTNLIYEDDTYKMGWTRKLSADDLADLRGIGVTAHLVQDWAPKCWECRVVVVGEDIFPVTIHAGSEASYVDWRSDYPSLSYEVAELPEQLTASLRAVMTELGLVYGAFDLAVGRGGDAEIVSFLEINPGGQYGFLEAASWCEITRKPDATGHHIMCEAGPTPLWSNIETAWNRWRELGAPAWHNFGLTATPTEHHIWHLNPHNGPRWHLPIPALSKAPTT